MVGLHFEAAQLVSKEIALGRVAGPFDHPPPPLQNLRLSPIGMVPKRGGSYRLIHHLPHPSGTSVNFSLPYSQLRTSVILEWVNWCKFHC